MKLSVIRWFFSLPAAMFYSLASGVMHSRVAAPSRTQDFAAIFASYLFPIGIALWVLADARRRRLSLPYDFDSVVFFAWWAMPPIYLFWTRGWRAFITLGWFVLLCLSAVAFGNLPAWFLADRP